MWWMLAPKGAQSTINAIQIHHQCNSTGGPIQIITSTPTPTQPQVKQTVTIDANTPFAGRALTLNVAVEVSPLPPFFNKTINR